MNVTIPREQIPWFPTIEEGQCDNCGTCLAFCKHGVYGLCEVSVRVVAPFNCVVGCSGCQPKCSNSAIRFPDLEEFSATVRRIRAEYAAAGAVSASAGQN